MVWILTLSHTHTLLAVWVAREQQAASSMSWEGVMVTGQQEIVNKLQQLPQVQHEFGNLDIQPSTSGNAMIIFVQGKIKVRGCCKAA